MEAFTTFTSRLVPLVENDIDTDQIIPARFLKVTDKVGLASKLFCDWRYDESGAPRPEFVLERPGMQGARVLLTGDNFGCGSSREHAPWALHDWGFRAVIARSFGDIFRNNALKNGLLPIVLPDQAHAALCDATGSADGTRGTASAAEVTIDLARQLVVLPDGAEVSFDIDPFARRCLLDGMDQLDYLLSLGDRITAHEARNRAIDIRRHAP